MAEEGAGGREVGRISIRVIPNTDRFRRDLQEQLDRIEKEEKVKVRIDPDLDGFRQKVDAATRNLKDAKVKVRADKDNHGELIHDLDSISDRVARDHKLKMDVAPHIQQSSFQKALRDVKTQAKLADVKMDVKFKDAEAEARLASLITRLKAEAKLANIDVDVKSHAHSLVKSGQKSGNAEGFNIGDSLGVLRLLGDQSIWIAMALTAFLAPALAMLSTALVSLPALITAVALPIGVFALGMGGIKKALDDSGILKETQKYDKKGRPVGKPKQSLGQFIKSIQQPIEDVFEKGFTPIFRRLLDSLSGAIPVLQRGLPFIAQGIVNFANGIVNAVTAVPNLQMMDRLTNSVGTMLTNLAPGVTSFTNGMVRLITDVGDHLPGLGNVMSGWADRFTNWVAKMDKPKDFWGKDIPNSSTLDSAVSNMKPALESIVNFVGQLVDAGLKLAANPQMGQDIKTVVDGLTNFITTGLPGLTGFFHDLAFIAKSLGLGPKDDSQKPKDQRPVGDKNPINQVPKGPWAGAPTLDPAKIPVLGKIESWWDHAVKSGSEFLDRNFDPSLLFKNQPVRPGIQMMGPGGQQQAPQPAPQPWNPAKAADGGAGSLGSGVTSQLQGVKAAVGPALAGIADGSDKVWDKLIEATKTAGSTIIAAVQAWVGQIRGAISGLGPAGSAAGQALGTGMAAGIAASAPSAIAAATALAQGVEAAAKNHLGIHSPSKVFQDIGQNTAQGFQNGLEGGFQGVIDSAKNLSQQVASAMSGGAPGDIGGSGTPYAPDHMPSVSGARPQWQTDLPGAGDAPGGGVMVPTGYGSDLQKQIKQQLGAIKVEQDRLRAEEAGTTDKGQKKAIRGQIDQLNVAKDQLQVQATQLGYSEKYGNSEANTTKQQEAQLTLQQEQLRAQKDATTDKGKKAGIQAQIDQIQAQKDLLKMQKDDSKKPKQDTKDIAQGVNKMIDIGKNFAMANVNQFESDIGISGKGAIPTIANIGLDWGISMLGKGITGLLDGKSGGTTNIHVNSIDEGLAAKQNIDNRQALTSMGAGR